jgi:hypothetical protein
MWKDQSTVQESRRDQFEKEDPRWRKFAVLGESAFNPWWTCNSDCESDSESDDEDVGTAGLAFHIFGNLRIESVDADADVDPEVEAESELSDSAEE